MLTTAGIRLAPPPEASARPDIARAQLQNER
jgi:hypothetical protein